MLGPCRAKALGLKCAKQCATASIFLHHRGSLNGVHAAQFWRRIFWRVCVTESWPLQAKS